MTLRIYALLLSIPCLTGCQSQPLPPFYNVQPPPSWEDTGAPNTENNADNDIYRPGRVFTYQYRYLKGGKEYLVGVDAEHENFGKGTIPWKLVEKGTEDIGDYPIEHIDLIVYKTRTPMNILPEQTIIKYRFYNESGDGQRLDPRRHIDAVADDVLFGNDDIAQVYADAQRHFGVFLHSPLDLYSALHGIHSAFKNAECAVSVILQDISAVLIRFLLKNDPVFVAKGERFFFASLHSGRIPFDIRKHDGGQFTFLHNREVLPGQHYVVLTREYVILTLAKVHRFDLRVLVGIGFGGVNQPIGRSIKNITTKC